MKKALLLAICLLTPVLLWSSTAFADGSPAEDTGDEFAPDQVDLVPTKLSHARAASLVNGAGIRITSSGGCSDRNRRNCTSLEQVNESTVNGIITFRRASSCAITITGGTEVGHASGTYSHWTGYKVDIAVNNCVDRYIQRTFTYIGKRGDGADLYRSATGNVYADEGNHWDITYF